MAVEGRDVKDEGVVVYYVVGLDAHRRLLSLAYASRQHMSTKQSRQVYGQDASAYYCPTSR